MFRLEPIIIMQLNILVILIQILNLQFRSKIRKMYVMPDSNIVFDIKVLVKINLSINVELYM